MKRVEVTAADSQRLRLLAMNTFCEIVLYGREAPAGLWDEAVDTVERVRELLDAYDPRSQLSVLCRLPAGEPHGVSAELFAILEVLCAAGEASSGVFDITTGALSGLWDFTAEEPHRPDPRRIAQVRERVGWGLMALDPVRKTVTLAREGIRLDAGAAGKGYAAGELAALLRRAGIPSASVNLGGNLYLLGPGLRDGTWAVGVQQPWAPRGTVLGTLRLEGDRSVSSSGGYDRYFVEDQKVWHHLLDPRTGCPAECGVLGCTVVCRDALLCDILSTVLFVGGEDCLRRTAEALRPGMEVGYVLTQSDGTVWISSELEGIFQPMQPV